MTSKEPRGRRHLAHAAVWLLLACAQFSGCGPTAEDKREALKFFGMTYFNYQQIWKKPPASWDEILTLAEDASLEDDRKLLCLVRDGGYTVVWGVDSKASNASDVVLAYHPDTPAAGGDVLFAEGSLRKLSGDELKKQLELK